MKKTLIRFVGVVLLFIMASAGSGNYYGTQVGDQAANFEVANAAHQLQLQALRGKYVVVTFWSSADADSRMANIRYDRAAATNARLEHVALNYDENQSLWSEICKLDGVNIASQFFARNENGAKLFKAWKQNEGFSSFLISPTGEIMAMNPSAQMLNQL
ncbi:MAG: redoxin domain-containing protein [bacterium]|nr:redoxin domain-containing protein [Muribaculaceae bacterium]MDD6833481.1 redoxin domain-containing protein [bacterium]MDD6901715.1 redoxin domain-containing protein [bacterium]MDY4184480.1 hypothetical protein [Sodaliphilus sp.]